MALKVIIVAKFAFSSRAARVDGNEISHERLLFLFYQFQLHVRNVFTEQVKFCKKQQHLKCMILSRKKYHYISMQNTNENFASIDLGRDS